jgi:hypothetical protein
MLEFASAWLWLVAPSATHQITMSVQAGPLPSATALLCFLKPRCPARHHRKLPNLLGKYMIRRFSKTIVKCFSSHTQCQDSKRLLAMTLQGGFRNAWLDWLHALEVDEPHPAWYGQFFFFLRKMAWTVHRPCQRSNHHPWGHIGEHGFGMPIFKRLDLAITSINVKRLPLQPMETHQQWCLRLMDTNTIWNSMGYSLVVGNIFQSHSQSPR